MEMSQTTSERSREIIDRIDSEVKELKTRQKEINNVVNILQTQVVSNIDSEAGNDKDGYKNFRVKEQTRSVSERMELIKAYVELQKLTVDINKTVITTYEKEHKMTLDLSKYIDNSKKAEDNTNALSPTDVIKLMKQVKKDKGGKDAKK